MRGLARMARAMASNWRSEGTLRDYLVTNNVVSLAQNLNSITQEMQLTFQPQKEQGEAVQLVLNGTRTVVIDVPFTLKDVPLP